MIRRGWGVGAAALAVAVMVAGCNGDPEPVVTPSPTPTETVAESPSPTPTPTPSATALTEEEILAAIPEAARTEDFPGAQAFTEFFVTLFPELFQDSANPELFAALSGPDCTFCQSALENASAAQAEGLRTEGGEIQFPDLVAVGSQGENGDWLVEHRYSESATQYLDPEGNIVDEDGSRDGKVVALIYFEDDRWHVRNIAFEYANAQ